MVRLSTARNKDRPRGCEQQLVQKGELFPQSLANNRTIELDARDPFYRGQTSSVSKIDPIIAPRP